MKKHFLSIFFSLLSITSATICAGTVKNYAERKFSGPQYNDSKTAQQIIAMLGEKTTESSAKNQFFSAAYDPNSDTVYISSGYNELYETISAQKTQIEQENNDISEQKKRCIDAEKTTLQQKEKISQLEKEISLFMNTPDAQQKTYYWGEKRNLSYSQVLKYYEQEKEKTETDLLNLQVNLKKQNEIIKQNENILKAHQKTLAANEALWSELDATIQHELAHRNVNDKYKTLQNSILDEGYACLVGEYYGGHNSGYRANNLSLFKSLLAAWGYEETPMGALSALAKAEALIKQGKSSGALKNIKWGDISIAEMNKVYDYLKEQTTKERSGGDDRSGENENEKEREKLLPSDTPTQPTQPLPENGGAGSNNSGNGGAENAGRAAGRAIIDGKTGSQTGTWNQFNR